MIYIQSTATAQRVYIPADKVATAGEVFTLVLSNTMKAATFTLSVSCVRSSARWYTFDITNGDTFNKGFYRYSLLDASDKEVANGYAFVGIRSTGTKTQHSETITIKQYGE